jgi:Ca-activated chloride channel family protein
VRRRLVVSVTLVVVAALFLLAVPRARGKTPQIPEKWRVWLEEEVYPLISSEQRKTFLALETDEQRTEFAEQLWQLWETQSGMGSVFRRTYQERLSQCRDEYGNTIEDRARVLLLQGPPDFTKVVDCEEVFNPLEFWSWERLEGFGQRVTILFYKPYGLGRPKLWEPMSESRLVLYSTAGQLKKEHGLDPSLRGIDRPENKCGDADELLQLIQAAEYWLKDINFMAALQHREVTSKAGAEAASSRFLKYSTLVAKGADPLQFDLQESQGGRRGGRVIVTFNIMAPSEGMGTAKVGDLDVIQIDVVGEITREGEMYDRFRYAFTFPSGSKLLPAQVERELRPGSYHLRLKVEDTHSNRSSLKEMDFTVTVPPAADLPADEAAAAVVEAAAAPSPNSTTLSLIGPEGESISGVHRFTALTGPKVAKVEFQLDGTTILTKNRPPFEVDLDLGPLPRLASVIAVAYDASGKELDRKQVDVNVGRERFHIRLQPVGKTDIVDGKVRAIASVNVPSDRKLDRMEIYWNEQLAATLYQSPFEAWVPLESTQSVGYLRAVAILDDGSQAEDIQFVNAPQFMSGIVVSSVHVPVTVLDRSKKPVEGMKQEEFSVLEDGTPQTITHFALQRDLPVRLGLVIDTSGSMEKTLPEVQRVVLGFLHDLLRPVDRAFVMAFSDRPALLEGFTSDFGALERAMISLRADRATAFYDATIYGLFQFSGVRGRKALILLTDGEDNASKNTFETALDYAQRSGATLYTIGVDLPMTQVRARSHLSRLAHVTGGEAFFLGRRDSLGPVYDQINRELRTQYQIVYTSNATTPTEEFRKITVKVSRPGVEVRTIAGYYPGS